MKATPFFSVIIPTLNEEKFLPKLLGSLATQTYRDFEVIVVDGKSRDRTVAVAESFTDRLPTLHILNSPRKNASFQRNRGADAAHGAYLLFLDADGVLFPYTLERLAQFVVARDAQFVTSWFSPDGDASGDALLAILGNMYTEGSVLVKRPVAGGAFFCIERKTFIAVGGFDEHITFGEDYDLGRRLKQKGIPLRVLRETLFIFSQRRIRREGKLKFFQLYARGSLLGLITDRSLGRVPGYLMGGHLYSQKPRPKRWVTLLRDIERRIKKLTKEVFE